MEGKFWGGRRGAVRKAILANRGLPFPADTAKLVPLKMLLGLCVWHQNTCRIEEEK